MTPPPPTYGQYHLPGFDWSTVGRVLVLPVHNESAYNRTGLEVRRALCAELQRLGRFEVVEPPPDYPACESELIHVNGRFNEAVMLDMAHYFAADVIVHVTITHYSPYARPRLGLVVQAVSPQLAKVVSGVDGLWDGGTPEVAMRVRDYYRSPVFARFPKLAAIGLTQPDFDIEHAEEIALESPLLFQRFVCSEVAQNLVSFPRPAAAPVDRLPMPQQAPNGAPISGPPLTPSNLPEPPPNGQK